MKRKRVNFPFKPVIAGMIILLAGLFIMRYIWKAFSSSDYFIVKEVIARGSDSLDLSYLEGRNIFSVNLTGESGRLLKLEPDCRYVRMVRVLPDRLFVDCLKRKPIALVKLYKYFALDEGGVFFDPPQPQEPQELPVIWGLETKVFGPKPGSRHNIKEVSTAISILKEARANRILKNYSVKKIDVSNLASTSIFISFPAKETGNVKPAESLAYAGYFEVKVGQEDIRRKIAILSSLIYSYRNELNDIKYIDLRFTEPVIKNKDAKTK